MIEAIIKEIVITPTGQPNPVTQQAAVNPAQDHPHLISTVYIGGGTPSILSMDELTQIFNALHQRFVFAPEIEITLEANPDDITLSQLKGWRQLGINRLSVGIQSIDEAELVWMNRAHTASQSLNSIDLIWEAGFTNFSVDLIYGSPILTDDNWKKNVDLIVEKNIPHISCYALTVEPKTALEKMIAKHTKEAVDFEKQARQFLLLMNWMKTAGYEHYEISNFAKPGFISKHNSSYWQGAPYQGFGPAAHSFDGKTRSWNVSNNSQYIQSLQQGMIPKESEILTEVQQLNEYIMTALRTMQGISLDYVHHHFGEARRNRIIRLAEKYLLTQKMTTENAHLKLTDEGKLFADGIAADLFF